MVDDAVGNITRALKRGGLWNNTLVVYTHDNGAPLGHGGSNAPLRGTKFYYAEGGVRVPAFVYATDTGVAASLMGCERAARASLTSRSMKL